MTVRALAFFVLAAAALAAEAEEAPIIEHAKFELFVADVDASTRFYRTLGFAVAEAKPDGYTTLVSGPVVVSLSPVSPWWRPRWLAFLRDPPLGTEIVLYTAHRLGDVHARLTAAGYTPGEIAVRPWGVADFRIHDPAGYYVRISEPPGTSRAE